MFPGFFQLSFWEHCRNVKNDSWYSFTLEQDKQCISNVTLWRVGATIFAVEKQELLHTPWMCVCTLWNLASNAHASYYLWPVRLQYIFFTLSHKPHDIRTKNLHNVTCLFWFSLQAFPDTFLILRRNEQDTIIMYIGLQAKCPLCLSDLNFSTDFRKICKYKIVWKSAGWEPSCSVRTEGQTDRHDEASSRFSQFCERA
jgi:hypothetical protein